MSRKSIAALLIVSSLAAPGCRSGWKVPSPSSMWPWSKQPSADVLAGTPTKPTIESPSTKHTPSAINSVAAGTGKSALGPGTTSQATASQATPHPSTTLASTTKPGYGGAAQSNQFQVGPYGMSGQAGTPAPAAVNPYANAGQTPPNAYAGTAGLPSSSMPHTTPNVGNPNGPSLNTTGQSGSAGFNPALGSSGSFASGSMPNAIPPMATSMPQFQPNMSTGVTVPVNSTVGFPSTPTSGSLGSMPPLPPPVMASSSNMPSWPTTGTTTIPNGTATGVALSGATMPVAQGQSPNFPSANVPSGEAYRPGSTGRATSGYNFTGGGATVPVNSGSFMPPPVQTQGLPPQNSTLPASSGYGSFQLPPNTANLPGQPVVR